jgi:hypothetical protein
MPLGPSAGSVARYTLAPAPSATERNPLLRLRSVFVYPGLAALTLIGVSLSAGTGQRLIAYCAAPGSATEAAFRMLAARSALPV